MRKHTLLAALAALGAVGATLALAQSGGTPSSVAKIDPARVEAAIKASWTTVAPEWLARTAQDETQRLCSAHGNAPPRAVTDAIMARERAAIVYPADGKLIGDWKKGEALAQNGYGGRFTDRDKTRANGGNCYACHQVDKKEVSFGTLGPSLAAYGRERKYSDKAVREVYERVFNAQAVLACSNMPRFGVTKFLSVEDITHLVALLMSPESPVNK